VTKLQLLREEAGFFTPGEFAAKAGLSFLTIRRAEKGEKVNRRTALLIARALGKPLSEIDDLNYPGKDGSKSASDQGEE
jgi:DNA-binding XRE family transcriptional regulator